VSADFFSIVHFLICIGGALTLPLCGAFFFTRAMDPRQLLRHQYFFAVWTYGWIGTLAYVHVVVKNLSRSIETRCFFKPRQTFGRTRNSSHLYRIPARIASLHLVIRPNRSQWLWDVPPEFAQVYRSHRSAANARKRAVASVALQSNLSRRKMHEEKYLRSCTSDDVHVARLGECRRAEAVG
jgi:hypothetical protein